MPSQTNRMEMVALSAIVVTALSGVVARPYLALSYAVPVLALATVVWAMAAVALSSWRAAIAGFAALLAAFAGILGAYFPALLLTILASVTLMRIEITKVSRSS